MSCSVISSTSEWSSWLNVAYPAHGSTVKIKNQNDVADVENCTDEFLVKRITTGASDLMAELIKRHSQRLFLLIRRMTPARQIAEDLLQETWLKVIKNFHSFDSNRPFSPWLTRIAVNCCREYWRKEKLRRLIANSPYEFRRSTPLLTDMTPTPTPDIQVEISSALLSLPQRSREVIVLKFYSGMTQAEISQVLNIPEGTVKSRLHSALQKLRRKLKAEK
jgi:RNA polymerase sigma-70 factor, ECF subfamily